jgi:hypothetical protein
MSSAYTVLDRVLQECKSARHGTPSACSKLPCGICRRYTACGILPANATCGSLKLLIKQYSLMRQTFLITTFLVSFCAGGCPASTQEMLLNLISDQPALYDFLNKSFDFSPDPNAPKETKAAIVGQSDPAKGMRYQVYLQAQRKSDAANTFFDITLNYIEVGYDKAGKPAFPPASVRAIPRIESVTIAQSETKKPN